MNPHQKPRPLFFTPRSPWGRLPLKRAHQSHMRASETASTATGKKPDPTPKELQGLGGAMAQNQLGGQPTQAGGAGDDVWKVPHTDPQNYQVPQQPASPRPEGKPQTFGEWARSDFYRQPGAMTKEEENYYRSGANPKPEEKGPLGKILSHFYAEAGYNGSHPGTEDKVEKRVGVGFATNSKMRTEMPFSEPNAAATPNFHPSGGEEDEELWKFANPESEGKESHPPEAQMPSPPLPPSLGKNQWQAPKTLKGTISAPQYPR